MKQYWLVLHPDTFLWIKEEEGLIYNTVNYSYFRFRNSGMLKQIMGHLSDIDNLYRISLTEEELKFPEIVELIEGIIKTESGNLVLDDGKNKRPVSLKPELRIQDDIDYYKWEHQQNIDGKIIQNLHKIIFYINGSKFGSGEYYKQTIYPIISDQSLDIEKICSFVRNGKASVFFQEVCLVGNPWEYDGFFKLLDFLAEMDFQVRIYCTEQDYSFHKEEAYNLEQQGIVFNILFTDYSDFSLFQAKEAKENENYTFIVTSVAEYNKASMCIEQWNLQNTEIIPVYTEKNLSFFQDYLYLTEEEITTTALSKREIFTKQALNIYAFGTLSVLPDGKVYANLNVNPIGVIDEVPYDIVYREMTEGHSWFRIRNQKPCCDCIYQWLCPSPSNYELVIGRPNLCHIQNGE